MEKHFSKKKYNVIQNILFCYQKIFQHMGKRYFILLPFQIISSVILPLLFAILPSMVIKILLSDLEVNQMISYMVVYVLMVCLTQFVVKRLDLHELEETFFFRISISKEFTAKSITIPYENLESPEGKERLEKARLGVYAGNDYGVEAVINLVASFMISVLGLMVYAVITARLHPAIMILLIVCPIARLVVMYCNRKWYEKAKEEWTPIDVKIRYLEKECLEISHGKDIRMYQIENWFVDLFYELINKRLGWFKKGVVRRWNARFVDRIITVGRDVCCYGYLIYQVFNGMDIGQFTLYLGVMVGFGEWVQKIFDQYNNLLDNNIIMNDYRTFMEQEDYWEIGGNTHLPKGDTHTITLEDISYTYPGSEEPVFEHFNLTIKKGEKLAIVGMNGSGKTTLIKLICGLYTPQEGRILLDGIDIRQFNLRDYYSLYSVVFQEVFAFAFPVRDNITCGIEKGYEEEKLDGCLQMAGLKEKIDTLPKGIHTNMLKDLDEDGINLSGGQMQKLMLARALYKDASMIILDEPTAALDPIAELEMYQKYNAFTKGKTSIFISHRLSSTVFCDRVIFMKDGKVIEDGTHESLMEAKGEYANMYALQAHYYGEEVKHHVC